MGLLSCLGAGGPLGGGGGFDPANYGSVALWYDMSDSTYCLDSGGNPASDGEDVQDVIDRSGNNYDGLMSTVSRQATWEANSQNGLGALQFIAADKHSYAIQNALGMYRNIPGATISIVMNCTEINNSFYGTLLNIFTPAGNTWLRLRAQYATGTSYYLYAASRRIDADGESTQLANAQDYAINTWHYFTVVIDYTNATIAFYGDGVEILAPTAFATAGSTENSDSNADPLFCVQDVGQNFTYEGLLGEFIVYNEALGSVDRAALEAALASKWGL